MTLGQILKGRRLELKMSLRDVERATKGRISNGYLSLLESDEIKEPSPHYLHLLSRAYSLDYSELMRLAGYFAPGPSRAETELAGLAFAGVDDLTAEEREDVIQYIEWTRSRRQQDRGHGEQRSDRRRKGPG